MKLELLMLCRVSGAVWNGDEAAAVRAFGEKIDAIPFFRAR